MTTSTSAQELISSGFMTDYSQLRKVTDGSADYRYIAPGAEDRLANYAAVMIDEPEIFISPDSEYKGAKPKQLVALSESLREGMASALTQDLFVVDRIGHNVLYLSLAISNLKLDKKKKKLRNFTPIGLIAGGVKSATSSDLAKFADLDSLVIEFEAFDSVTGDRLVAVIDSISDFEEGSPSWEELDRYMAMYGQQIRCRFLNSKIPEEQRADCLNRH